MASALSERLSGIVKTLRGQARITEDNVAEMLREVRMALLEADVALPVVRDFIARVKEKALGEEVVGSLTPGQVLVSIVNRELAATMGEGVADINLAAQPPAVILMAGLQGAGKTTTTAKLAKHLIEKRKKKVLTVSGDVYRPAAIEQLKTVSAQAGAEWFPSSPDQKPADIARAALDHAKRHFFDVLLVDTAGRLAIDEALMREIQELHGVLKPVETLFVVDAMQGQDAVNTGKAFSDALPLTGIILTKTDGDSRGGAALSVRHITGVPIKFAGVSEKIDGLEVFDAERHAGRILGMGDIVALVEQVTRLVQPHRHAARRHGVQGLGHGHGPRRARHEAQGRHHLQHDRQRAHAPRHHQGHAQKTHRRRRGCSGAGSQPLAQRVRANARHDEKNAGRRHDENDEAHERHERHARHAQTAGHGLLRGYQPAS